MRVLAIDTAMARCSVAVFDAASEQTEAHVFEDMQRGHAEALSGMIEAACTKANVKLSDIGRIAVTTGPGTFTGVRVGLAMAKGLALALDKPAIGISTLEVIAANTLQASQDERPLCVISDARRDEVYTQAFSSKGDSLTEPGLYRIEDVGAVFGDLKPRLTGSGAELVKDRFPETEMIAADPLPNAVRLARLAANRDPENSPARPLYIRKPDAKPQKQLVTLKKREIEIEAAGPLQAEIMAELHRFCFPKPWTSADLAEMLKTPGIKAYIGFEIADHTPLAFAIIRHVADEAEIITIGTRPDLQRRQIGQQVFNHVIKDLRSANVKSLFLEVSYENAAARGLYAKLGFKQVGKRDRYYVEPDGARSDALILALDL